MYLKAWQGGIINWSCNPFTNDIKHFSSELMKLWSNSSITILLNHACNILLEMVLLILGLGIEPHFKLVSSGNGTMGSLMNSLLLLVFQLTKWVLKTEIGAKNLWQLLPQGFCCRFLHKEILHKMPPFCCSSDLCMSESSQKLLKHGGSNY